MFVFVSFLLIFVFRNFRSQHGDEMGKLAVLEAENSITESTPDSSATKAPSVTRPGTSAAGGKLGGVPTPSKKGLVISDFDSKPLLVF